VNNAPRVSAARREPVNLIAIFTTLIFAGVMSWIMDAIAVQNNWTRCQCFPPPK
jgi:hypothetical protein